ncbi:MAG: hypothetical protein FIB07_17640 [Candidatus Methanoperedens sp.]|nr:hypothetical protein [Candidatus Methanoperedens sp.]
MLDRIGMAKNSKYVSLQSKNAFIFEKNEKKQKRYVDSILISLICLLLIVVPSFAAPATPNDNWKIVFDSGMDIPFNYSTSFTPKVWVYNQGGNPVSTATVSYTYFNVNDNSQISTGTATNNGGGSYSGPAINMPNYAGKYINVLFSVTAGSNILREQHVFFAGQSNAAHGALWKIEVFNTSTGPSWDGTNQQKIYMKLYSDAGTPYRNNLNTPTIAVWNSTGASVISATAMTYEEDGVYSYTIPGYANGDYYFEIYNRWASRQVTGSSSRYTATYAGLYLEANNTQSDESLPQIDSVNRKPYFPVDDDYVNVTAHALDNFNITSATLYYTINNQTVQTRPMVKQTGLEYNAMLNPYLLEDNVRYRVEVNDGTNTVSSPWYMYNVQDHRGSANMSHSFMSHPAYWFGYSRQANLAVADRGGDTNYDGVYSTTEKDGVAYLAVTQSYPYFKDMTRIKVQSLIMDETGKPIQHLTNVKAWLSNNKTQPPGTHNREKTMTEVAGESGVYNVTWEGSPDVPGTAYIWNDDAKAIWGQYISGEVYSVYIDINGDGQPEENITWLAYNIGDTYWGSSENGRNFNDHANLEQSSSCSRSRCHNAMSGTRRVDGEPNCADCHGVYKNADNGVWPVEKGSGVTEDSILYGNSTGHPRQDNNNVTTCGDETCHNVAWGTSPSGTLPVEIPGYPAGTRLNGTFNAKYPNPIQCAEHHDYKGSKIPVEEGHNKMVACKYCHGGSHSNNKLLSYNVSINGTNTSNVNRGTPGYVGTGGINGSGNYAGNCYTGCHKVQVEHSLTGKPGGAAENKFVPCDECHKDFNNAPMHQESLFPYDNRSTCGACHQDQGTISAYNTTNGLTLNPPRIPNPQTHAQQTGFRWNNTGLRPYWVENENSCRYCHGRSYNEAYGLGRIRSFMGNNEINGTINSTSYWCSACHVNTSTQNYTNMVNIFNYSFGVVPPEITNSTWASNRAGYVDHQADGSIGVNRTLNATYNDSRCFECHGGSLSIDVKMDRLQHQVSASGTTEDTTPPASVTALGETATAETSITWSWTNPSDSDFDHVEVYLDSVFKTNVTSGTYTATGLNASTTYTIGTKTVDTVGNVNASMVTDPATTASDATPPSSVTGLGETATGETSITWSWTNPSDPDFDHVEVYIDSVFKTNMTSGTYTASGLNASTTYTIGIKTVDTTGNVNSTTVTDSAITSADATPPASVTALGETATGETSITWSWTNPSDSDFDHVEVYLDSVFKTNVTSGTYTATGLNASTTYTIGTKTVDTTGNVNATTVSDSANTTASGDTTPPTSVINLANVSYAQNYINWTWTDPQDQDFDRVMVYLNGAFQNNVTKGVQYYNASVSPGTYTIGTRTVDATGNVNTTMVTHTATTILPSVRYINGSVIDSVTKTAIPGVTVSINTSLPTMTNETGFYSFTVTEGTFDLSAKLDPTYNANSSIIVSTIGSAVVIQDIELVKKPTGTISGIVSNG